MKSVIEYLNLRRVAKYAICLFLAQFALGFAQGLLAASSGDVQEVMHQFAASVVASLVIAAVLFLLASIRHGQPPWSQACAILLLYTGTSVVFGWLVGIWLELSPVVLRLTEWLGVVLGALFGTAVGAFFARQRVRRVADMET